MKKTTYFIYSLIILLFVSLTACSTATDPAETYRDETQVQIFKGGEEALRDKNYTEAIKRFEALDVQYPYGVNTETAQLHIIYAYYMNGDYATAEAAADRFVHAHPTSPNVDYAYYMRGLSNYYQNLGVLERMFSVDYATRDLTQVKKSFNDFSELVRRYPQSYYAPAAHQYMVYLRNVLANHELQVGQFYFDRGAYVAAANRASLVVQHFEGSPVVPDALVMMAKSYHQLQMTQAENETIAVLQLNYPNSKYVEEVTTNANNSAKFKIITKQQRQLPVPEKAIVEPPKETMPEGNGYQAYPMNGNRGSVTSMADVMATIRKKPTTPGATAQTSAESAAVAPRQSQTVSENPNSQRSGSQSHSGFTLGDVFDKISKADFFNTKKKPESTQESSQAQPPVQEEVAQTPLSTPGNGAR